MTKYQMTKYYRIMLKKRMEDFDLAQPSKFRGARLSDFSHDIMRQCKDWMRSGKWCLIIFGAVGTGKTHLLYAIVRHLHFTNMLKGEASSYEASGYPLLLERLRHDNPERGQPRLIETMIDRGILALDDFGTHKETDWATEKFGTIVDERWKNQWPIILTTNLDTAQLKENVPERVYSRLCDGVVAIRLSGKDRRRDG